ncbi:MAG: Ni/Fe hydrogenase subunit alpha [Planctomycetia bacterium]
MSRVRKLSVKSLTRVEGEGGLCVRVADGTVEIAEFNIYEPPRFFEKLVVGREVREVPDIVARICGICPVAYQMSACQALEQALGIETTPAIAALRRILYCGEWIQSHSLHVHLLDAPDFLGCESGFSMPPERAPFLERGLRMKQIGSRLIEVLGGRAVHPINVTVGGFYKSPPAAEVQALLPDLEWGIAAAEALVAEVACFEFPDFRQPHEYVAVRADDEYPMNHGRVVAMTVAGRRMLDIPVADYERHFRERQVPHSTALHSLIEPDGRAYLCGPLARMATSRDLLPPRARRAADASGIDWPSGNPFQAIVARAIELVAAFEEAARIAGDYAAPLAVPRIEYAAKAGEACHATEAPRGLLYHRYRIGDDGLIAAAAIVPPTSQNQARIEADLKAYLPTVLDRDDADATRRCEHLIRTYDPCISCATHFLRIER